MEKGVFRGLVLSRSSLDCIADYDVAVSHVDLIDDDLLKIAYRKKSATVPVSNKHNFMINRDVVLLPFLVSFLRTGNYIRIWLSALTEGRSV